MGGECGKMEITGKIEGFGEQRRDMGWEIVGNHGK
jgi:hypothetical protein